MTPDENDRRIELIHKDIGGTLTDAERVECDRLELLASEVLASVAPFPPINDDTRRIITEYLTDRRVELIRRKHCGELTDAEAAELDALQADSLREIQAAFPVTEADRDELRALEAMLTTAR